MLIICAAAIVQGEERGEPALIGAPGVHQVEPGETLLGIGTRYGIGYDELIAANPDIEPWTPTVGTRVVLPTLHLLPTARAPGLVINLGDFRIYHFPDDGSVPRSWPVGIGREHHETPLMVAEVTEMRRNPTWRPTAQHRETNPDLPVAVPPGPDNPLGPRAIRIGWQNYLIHGTNKPAGIGRQVSRGCIRLFNDDIIELFGLARIGMRVEIVDEPVKLGWSDGALYLEVHGDRQHGVEMDRSAAVALERPGGLLQRIKQEADVAGVMIDWTLVDQTRREATGRPVRISR
ncbi:MAG: L,D-transpeptidase family protein [Geminicoccaceae bacterium]